MVDANALLAATDVREAHTEAVSATLRRPGEAAFLIQRDCGPLVEARFLESLSTILVVAPKSDDWIRIAQLVRQHADRPLGGTDASVVALAERLKADTIITLDRRHFDCVRPPHVERFNRLPG